jgi:hypothetical protein
MVLKRVESAQHRGTVGGASPTRWSGRQCHPDVASECREVEKIDQVAAQLGKRCRRASTLNMKVLSADGISIRPEASRSE